VEQRKRTLCRVKNLVFMHAELCIPARFVEYQIAVGNKQHCFEYWEVLSIHPTYYDELIPALNKNLKL
jgi:hypothetical protein